MISILLGCLLFMSSFSVISAQNFVFSTIRDDNYLSGIAGNLNANIQREANRLLNEFVRDGTDGGRGSRHLFGGIFELRGSNGARLYLVRLERNTYLLLAKSDKKTQQKVIDYLESSSYVEQEKAVLSQPRNRNKNKNKNRIVHDELRRRKQSGYQDIQRRYYIKRWGHTLEVTPQEYAQIAAMYYN